MNNNTSPQPQITIMIIIAYNRQIIVCIAFYSVTDKSL